MERSWFESDKKTQRCAVTLVLFCNMKKYICEAGAIALMRKVFALHVVDLGLNSGIPYGSLGTARCDY